MKLVTVNVKTSKKQRPFSVEGSIELVYTDDKDKQRRCKGYWDYEIQQVGGVRDDKIGGSYDYASIECLSSSDQKKKIVTAVNKVIHEHEYEPKPPIMSL